MPLKFTQLTQLLIKNVHLLAKLYRTSCMTIKLLKIIKHQQQINT